MGLVYRITFPVVCAELSPSVGSSQVGSLGFSQVPPPASGRKGERRAAEDTKVGGAEGAVGAIAAESSRCPVLSRASYLDELSIAGECAAEYLALYQKLITSAHWKVYLAARGVLPYVGNLITKVPPPAQESPSPVWLPWPSTGVNFLVFLFC